jgi:hypothetical protein
MLSTARTSMFVLVASTLVAAGCGDSGSSAAGSGGGSTSTDGSGGGTSTSGSGGGSTTTNATGATTSTSASNGSGGGSLTFTSSDCVTECQQGQATQGCTTLTGDCQNCCDAAVSLAPKAMCEAEFNAYYDCISAPADPCNPPVDCSAEQDGLKNCATNYCFSNLSDPDCGTLAGCFQMGG